MPLFTVAEARAFKHQGQASLASAQAYPDELIEGTEARLAEEFADICGVAFAPVEAVETLDGGGGVLVLPHRPIASVDEVETYDGAAWSAFAGAYRLLDSGILAYDGGYWPRGRGTVRVTYTHGYAEPPLAIRRAALILAVDQLAGSNVSDRATQQTNEYGTYNLAVAGWREGQYYGIPVVDSVLAREAAKWRGPRVG